MRSASSTPRMLNGVLLIVGHTFEHDAAIWKLRDIANSGELGEIRYIDSARLNLGLYQEDVNVIWDLAPHDVSIINFILGRPPTAVSAWGHSHANRGYEDVAHIQLRYARDRRARVHPRELARPVQGPARHDRRQREDGRLQRPRRSTRRSASTTSASKTAQTVDPAFGEPVEYRRGDIVSPHAHAAGTARRASRPHDQLHPRTGETPRTDGRSGLAVAARARSRERPRCTPARGAPRDRARDRPHDRPPPEAHLHPGAGAGARLASNRIALSRSAPFCGRPGWGILTGQRSPGDARGEQRMGAAPRRRQRTGLAVVSIALLALGVVLRVPGRRDLAGHRRNGPGIGVARRARESTHLDPDQDHPEDRRLGHGHRVRARCTSAAGTIANMPPPGIPFGSRVRRDQPDPAAPEPLPRQGPLAVGR